MSANVDAESSVLKSVLSLIVHVALCGATWCSSPCWQALRLSCLSENHTLRPILVNALLHHMW